MAKRSDQEEIKHCFYQMNRVLTWTLVVLVALVSATFWYLGYAATDKYSTRIGLVLMGLAVIFYKLPYISYLFTKRRYKHSQAAPGILDQGWKSFNSWLDR